MVILCIKLKHIYGFDDFSINLSYPRKLSFSLLGDESLPQRSRFRYRKAVILMGTNAAGKTSLGRALLKIFSSVRDASDTPLRDFYDGTRKAEFQIDFVNEGFIMHRFSGSVDGENVIIRYSSAEIGENDSYEMTERKLKDRSDEIGGNFRKLRDAVGPLEFRFAYPEIDTSLHTEDIGKDELLKTMKAVLSTLDPTLSDISTASDLKDSFVIRRRGKEIIIQDGRLLSGEFLSSGTREGVDVAVFLASMKEKKDCFYYCDEHFSYIQSDIEKRICGLMLERLTDRSQLIFTTHNTDMLNLNLPNHSFAFMKKEIDDGEYRVSVTFASDVLKRGTDSVRCAYENNVFASLPDDSPLDILSH